MKTCTFVLSGYEGHGLEDVTSTLADLTGQQIWEYEEVDSATPITYLMDGTLLSGLVSREELLSVCHKAKVLGVVLVSIFVMSPKTRPIVKEDREGRLTVTPWDCDIIINLDDVSYADLPVSVDATINEYFAREGQLELTLPKQVQEHL